MGNVIDWSQYGRAPARQRVVNAVRYVERDGRVFVEARIPLDELDVAIERMKAQRDYWVNTAGGTER